MGTLCHSQEKESMTQPTLMSTYGRLPVMFERGEGVWLYDTEGVRYLDALSGVAVNALGHAHPAVVGAIQEQAARLIHTSNVYRIQRQEELGDLLCGLAEMERVFFCNSGAEANEAAIKLARLYGHRRNIERPTIIVMEKSFHGRTMATLTATGSRKIQAGFEPLVAGFTRAPYGDMEALRTIARNNPDVVAVLLEPAQGEGGVNLLPAGFLRELRELCDERSWLLMLDEVQTGNGRTGAWFAYQHDKVLPDVVATAKGLGNGVPIGACMARGIAAELFQPGSHGSTFGGNPLACAAALAVLRTIDAENLLAHVTRESEFLLSELRARLADVPGVVEVRGFGLLLGIELDRPCGELVRQALEQKLLINVTADRVVRLLPPLIIQRTESEQLLDTLCPLIEQFCKGT
ncbi:MAG: acetylornithine transaminase [Spongiibacteraceae bacterium]|nr:acetylornithine transaminase [Spongiibacteraceae bacterium]